MRKEVKPQLLYVDDEPFNLVVLKTTLSGSFDIITSDKPEEAVEIFKSNPTIQLVLSDYCMPGMNGMELIKTIKHINSQALCFILSGYDKTDEVLEAIENEVLMDYFIKPFSPEILSKKLLSAFNMSVKADVFAH